MTKYPYKLATAKNNFALIQIIWRKTAFNHLTQRIHFYAGRHAKTQQKTSGMINVITHHMLFLQPQLTPQSYFLHSNKCPGTDSMLDRENWSYKTRNIGRNLIIESVTEFIAPKRPTVYLSVIFSIHGTIGVKYSGLYCVL